jgi:ABC-type glycerol-3-phosphate transport system substrate-binding protein
MKRITALLLLTAILLAGCGGSNDPGESPESNPENTAETVPQTPQETEPLTDGLPETDMDGFEMRFYNYDDTFFIWAENRLDAETIEGELINDTIYERNRKLESRFSAVIKEERVGNTETNLKSILLAGDHAYDVAMMGDWATAKYYTDGLVLPWNNLPYVNLDKPWWSQDANGVFNIGGKQFAAVGDFSLSMHSRNYLYILNKDMYVDLGGNPKELYDAVYGNTWTFDRLFEEGRKAVWDLDGNGVLDSSDRYGVTSSVKLEFGALISGAGIRYIDEKDGALHFVLTNNEYAVEVMQKIFDLHTDDTYRQFLPDGFDNTDFNFFLNGHALFLGTSMKYIEKFRDMAADIGYLPIPKYTEEQERYYSLSAGGTAALLPFTIPSDRLGSIGILLEAMSFASHRELVPAYLETIVKTKYTRDEDSTNMLQIIIDSSFYDLGVSVLTSCTQTVLMESVYYPMNNVIVSTISSMEKQVENELLKITEAGA